MPKKKIDDVQQVMLFIVFDWGQKVRKWPGVNCTRPGPAASFCV